MEKNLDLYQYSNSMSKVKLIRWNVLPNFPVYCDQLLQIVNDELSFMQISDEQLITKSMVNNYVKWNMIPKPVKKKYEKLHIASVIVITILKPILPISKIKDGIQLQTILQGNERAYDAFCEVLEESIRNVFLSILDQRNPYVLEERKIEFEKLAISSITTALASKLLTEKIIETKIKKYNDLERGKGETNE
jgi:hypothetical protein